MSTKVKVIAYTILLICATIAILYRATTREMMIKKYAVLFPIMIAATIIYHKKDK